jgi:prepilin-type N-terminal cleavage/methylation domain-containing protein
MKKIFKKLQQKTNQGFTLIEMVVVLGIFAILTSVTIYNYGDFNDNIILTNLSYEVALEIRQAQVYSLGVRSSALPGSSLDEGRSDFDTRFGTYLNLQKPDGDKNIVFFTDLGGLGDSGSSNGMCDYGNDACAVNSCVADADNECREIATLSHSVYIEDICVNSGELIDGDTFECLEGSSVADESNGTSFTFERPNPDLLINGLSNKNAAIILATPRGQKRAVIINNTGQISVEFLTN